MSHRPNIVFVLVDDMGYGDFGVFNDDLTHTPALDHLVSEGICLTQHYSGSCVCAPARAALLTGRYPHRTGAIDTLEGRGLDRLSLRETTLADILKSAGYTTGLIGKWHLGALDPRYHPNARGFEEFVGFRGGWQDYYDWHLDYNGTREDADGRYLTDLFTDEAISFMRRHRDEPFFLHLTYNAPHFPFQAPEEDVEPFAETGHFTEAVSTLYGMLQRMDKGLERILHELDRQEIAENTIFFFTSDNGPQFGGEGEMCTTRFNCGFNGAKGHVYEGGIRVPMVIRWPAGLEDGYHHNGLIHFVDWLPTLFAMLDLETPSSTLPLDGHDVLPILRGEDDPVDVPRFWQWNRYTPLVTCNAAMRHGPWKLVRPRIDQAMQVSEADLAMDRALKYQPEHFDNIRRAPEPERNVPPPPDPELYNIEEDPLEKENLTSTEPQRTRRMLQTLETWFEKVEAERQSIEDDVW
ncbi:MAG: sulfatase-like hydrolase/transferase [Chloroflexota bacterium]